MSDDSALREKAREAILSGRLPSRRPDRLWGGPASGEHDCVICGKLLSRDEVQYDLQYSAEGTPSGSVDLPVHLRCFDAWEIERHRVGLPQEMGISAAADVAGSSVLHGARERGTVDLGGHEISDNTRKRT
jgi:hypothetical protein